MGQAYFMGIDNGGSSTKCVIFDQNGSIVSSASTRIALVKPAEGYTERSTDEIWRAVCHVTRNALVKSKLAPTDIKAVSVCGYGGGLILLDYAGNPTAPGIVSTDSRASDLLTFFQNNGTDDLVYERTFQRLWAGQHAMLLSWYKQEQPQVLSKSSWALSIKDFLRYKLTGVIGTECTDASNTNLFNIKEKRFDSDIFRVLGIPNLLTLFPERIFSPFEIAGTVSQEASDVTGLCPGIPVVAGLYDVASCTLGSGILDASQLALVIGTWGISSYLTKDLTFCRGRNNTLLSFLDGWYASEESSPTSASNLDWFVENFYRPLFPDSKNIYESCNQLVAKLDPNENDLIFLPYLYGSNSSIPSKAGFFNLSGHHTPAHILMAIYEGILFSLVQHIHTLCDKSAPKSARLSGGVSRSPLWCQMLADILGVPIETSKCKEVGALGAAICASIGSGFYTNPQDAVQSMYQPDYSYEPIADRTILYKEKYLAYQRAVDCVCHFHSFNNKT